MLKYILCTLFPATTEEIRYDGHLRGCRAIENLVLSRAREESPEAYNAMLERLR